MIAVKLLNTDTKYIKANSFFKIKLISFAIQMYNKSIIISLKNSCF